MRIIDKNKDFYDYVQYEYYDDTFTFDRTKSYIMTKKDIIHYLPLYRYTNDTKRYLLMQICHTFWLFELDVKLNNNSIPVDYDMSLLQTWTNYNSKRELIKLSVIESWHFRHTNNYSYLIDINDYKEFHVYNCFYIYRGNEKEEKNIPILREIGIASLIDAHDIYNALEMYYSEEKTDSERTEPIGSTNNDKITSHGFDLVSSFRG